MQAPTSNENPLQRKLRRVNALRNERESWRAHWREISEYQTPRSGRYFLTDRNKGDKRHNNIYDNTAIFGIRTLASGLMSGMTSPARQWFRLTLADKDLAENGAVKLWLHHVAQIMRAVFAASNTYRALHSIYEELGAFGTSASIMLPDFDNVVHHFPLTIGEYALGANYKGEVDTLTREFQLTVGQAGDEFGLAACSESVRNLYLRGDIDKWIDVTHVIESNRKRDGTKLDSSNMKWSSCYFEPGQAKDNKFLRESGFKRFPVLAPRWVVTANDVYGQSPGMECLGDVKQLQHQQLRKSQAIDYKTNPPLQVPTAYKDFAKARLPGGVFFIDSLTPSSGVRSAFEVNIDLNHLMQDIGDVRERIRSAYYADLFLMLANDTRSGVTATEVAERHEEKLLMLGPVLERLHNELLSPMIDQTFDHCVAAGILPDPPREMEDMELTVEFVSTLAQAQRAVAAAGADRVLTTVGNLAAMKPDIIDKIDFDQVVDDYAEMFGVNPAIIVPDDVVAKIRAERAQAAQAAQMAATAPQAVESAKTASEIDAGSLQDVLGMFQGYNSPTAQEVGV